MFFCDFFSVKQVHDYRLVWIFRADIKTSLSFVFLVYLSLKNIRFCRSVIIAEILVYQHFPRLRAKKRVKVENFLSILSNRCTNLLNFVENLRQFSLSASKGRRADDTADVKDNKSVWKTDAVVGEEKLKREILQSKKLADNLIA